MNYNPTNYLGLRNLFESISDISLLNMMPVGWLAYLPFIIGIFGIIVLFSIIILVVSWLKKRKTQLSKSEVEFTG